MKRRVLIVHLHLQPIGGGQSVAAWTLDALKSTCDITLLTWNRVDCDGLNRFFGTSLQPGDFEVRLMPPIARRILDASPTPSALFKTAFLQRACQRMVADENFDFCMSTSNEFDFGCRGIQYVHFPASYLPRPRNDWHWYHIDSAVASYRALTEGLARTSLERLRSNLTLANSDFIGGLIREAHGINSVTVYPPVPGGFPHVSWKDREDAIACIGRLSPEKKWDEAVEVVRRIREAGRPVRLTLIGHSDNKSHYEERLRALAREHPWLSILIAPPRAKMLELVARHRYALHPMVNEHFGIAPAELQSAGCITFVHRSGGPMEIVGCDERLMFDDVNDAARKIQTVLASPMLQSELREQSAQRAECFTSARFVARIREIAAEFQP
jgi:glycosyltransferase involved in cell wall biosynthesis